LLRASIQGEIKDLMFGHARQSARKHYNYDEQTIRENYAKAFEHLSINGVQTRQDIAKLKEDMAKKNEYFTELLAQQQKQIEELKESIKGLYLVNVHYRMTVERTLWNRKTGKWEKWTETINTPEEMEEANKKFLERAKRVSEGKNHDRE
jgi:hypothetical protein